MVRYDDFMSRRLWLKLETDLSMLCFVNYGRRDSSRLPFTLPIYSILAPIKRPYNSSHVHRVVKQAPSFPVIPDWTMIWLINGRPSDQLQASLMFNFIRKTNEYNEGWYQSLSFAWSLKARIEYVYTYILLQSKWNKSAFVSTKCFSPFILLIHHLS